jgi:CHAT domain-containing protein/tetratricopeptide (TPR) repeat protein
MICRLLCLRFAIGVISMGLTLDYLPFIAQSGFPVQAQTPAPTAAADRRLQAGQQALNQQQFPLALKHLQAALALYRQQRNQAGEGKALEALGDVYYAQQDYRTAIELHQQALVIWRQTGDRQHEAIGLDILGLSHLYLSELQNALAYFNQALLLWRVVGDSPEAQQRQQEGEANTLNNIGLVYDTLGEKQTALDYYNQSLAILRAVGDRRGEANTLNNIGRVYDDLGEKQTALKHYNQALSIWRTEENSPEEKLRQREGEANTLNNIGLVYDTLGEKKTALDYYNQALVIWRAVGDRRGEANTLSNIGAVYNALGERQTALKYYNQALPIQRAVSDRVGEAITLNNIGLVYDALNEKQTALKYYNQSLPILRVVGDRAGEATTLSNVGAVYDALDEKQTALKYYDQALPIFGALGDRAGQARTLNNIGRVYSALGEKQTALDYYNQALPLWYAVGHREGAARTLNNMGLVLTAQNQPQLAIVFYKQSVNLYETIRDGIRTLPRASQESYIQTVVDTYRNLADLLIQQGRLSEAQAVLELLKLRELREFTRDAGIQSSGISLAKVEEAALKQILAQFTTVGNFTQKLAQCQQTNCSNLRQLKQQRDALTTAIRQELNQQRAILAKHFSTENSTLTPTTLETAARSIVNAQPGTVLIYPLVLKDKIQFLVAFQAGNGAVTFRPFETQVSAQQLFKAIQIFRNHLSETTPGGRPIADLKTVQASSQQLYTWLIKPLEAELKNSAIKHLVFAPDSTTRYIPLAALYDGQQYLIQRFTVSTITAASETDTTTRTPKPTGQAPMLLAMGASYFPNLNPLTYVPAELDAITKTNASSDRQGIYPGSKYLDRTFDYEALQASLEKETYRILHLATHGAFKAGRPEDSYLVLGSGRNLTTELIDQLGNYGLGNIHLVVLSACQTAVGDRATDGIEIPGISHFFLKNRVKSVIASLWNVNDASTALIMQQFYKHLANGMTKAEALKTVQQDLIQSTLTAKDAPARSDISITVDPGVRTLQNSTTTFSHPYYWAPFILIGNSL